MSGDADALAAAQNAPAADPPEAQEADGGNSPAVPESGPIESIEQAQEALAATRKEAANYRTAYSPYKAAFEGIDDSTRDVVLDAVAKLRSGDLDGAKAWVDLGKRMMSEEEWGAYIGTPVIDPVTEVLENTEEGERLTLDQIGKLMDQKLTEQQQAEREAQRQIDNDNAAKALVSKATEWGFQPGSPQFKALFGMAIDNGITLEEARTMYEKTFPQSIPTPATGNESTEEPPAVPVTGSTQTKGGAIETPATEQLTAAEKMERRIDAAVAADAGLG